MSDKKFAKDYRKGEEVAAGTGWMEPDTPRKTAVSSSSHLIQRAAARSAVGPGRAVGLSADNELFSKALRVPQTPVSNYRASAQRFGSIIFIN